MQKLIELTSKDFMSGLAISSQMPTGIFIDGSGINPFRNPFSDTADAGLLQTSEAAQTITGATDSIWAGTLLGSSYLGYFIGDAGHLYSINTSGPTALTDLRSGTPIINPAGGITIYQTAGGSKFLYYARESFIGRWDLTSTYPTNWADTYAGSGGSGFAITLQTTKMRMFHHFLGNVYFSDKNYVGTITDNHDTSLTITSQDLDLPSTFTITSMDDDGYYLVIAATENSISGNILINTLNKIFFWDTNANSWNKEWEIPTPYIAAIRRVGDIMYALCADGLYAFSFSIPPTLLVPLSANDSPATVGGVLPTNEICTVKHGVFYWMSSNKDVCAYGPPIPGMKPRFFKPFKGTSGEIPSFLMSIGKLLFLTGDYDDGFGSINVANGGATSRSAETIFMPLERKWDIKRIEITLGEPMVSGDELNIDVKSDEDTSATDWGTMSFAAHGAVRTVMLYGSYHAENLKLVINFVAGNVKVKKICVYGEPVTI